MKKELRWNKGDFFDFQVVREYKDKIYTFAMNGQTGKLVGELPIDKCKARKYLFGITAVIFIILQIFVWI